MIYHYINNYRGYGDNGKPRKLLYVIMVQRIHLNQL